MAVFYGLAVFTEDVFDLAVDFGEDVVRDLHRFNDADLLAFGDWIAAGDKGRRAGGGEVEPAYHRGGDEGFIRRGLGGRR